MAQNFIDCDREQAFLMPPSLRDWLPEDHLAWFVIETVEQLDLAVFYAAYRADGHGRAAYDPAVMVGLVLFAYSTKEYSSRGIERHCRQDIAYRVITGNRVPDHATIARFIKRHQAPLGELFGSVLKLCAKAGLVSSGVVAIDGTKVHANACQDRNASYDEIAKEIIAQGIATDETEDEQHGELRGDELPAELQSEAGRREWLVRELAQQREEREPDSGEDAQTESDADVPAEGEADPTDGFDVERILERNQGRKGWVREAKRMLDQDRWDHAGSVPRSRTERLWDAAQRMEDELAAERRGHEAYEHWRETGVTRNGRRPTGPQTPWVPPAVPPGEISVTDPDARIMNAHRNYVLGYNAQAAVNEQQIVLAAEITVDAADFSHLNPIVSAVRRELAGAGAGDKPEVVLADAGYWNEQHMDNAAADGITVLIPPDSDKRQGQRPGWTGGRYTWMRYLLASELGGQLYRKRKTTVEPVFGHTKHNRKFDRFNRRGRGAVRTEWRLMMATHNLTKLHSRQIATVTA